VTGLARSAKAAGPERAIACDLLDAPRLAGAVREASPSLVVNAQALSDVDRCEREPKEAEAQNVRAVANLAAALAGQPAVLVHVSTDYVFDGTKGSPYVESDTVSPVNVYGRSKVQGEAEALKHPRAVVVRTSTLFGPARKNFCDWTATQLLAGKPVEAFTDQVTSPTYTADLADGLGELGVALEQCWAPNPSRTYHMVNAGAVSRVEFAERVAALLGAPRELIQRIPMAAQRRPALRPAFSALSTTEVPKAIGRTLRSWDDGLQAYLRERRLLDSARDGVPS